MVEIGVSALASLWIRSEIHCLISNVNELGDSDRCDTVGNMKYFERGKIHWPEQTTCLLHYVCGFS